MVITHAVAAGRAAADPADADGISQRQPVRHDAERRMGWDATRLTGKEVLIIGTRGGIRVDGRPVALLHRALGDRMQMQAAAMRSPAAAGSCLGPRHDPCDGRSQDARHVRFLPYRNDAVSFRRLIRPPDAAAVIGVATCDKAVCLRLRCPDAQTADQFWWAGGATLPLDRRGRMRGKVSRPSARARQSRTLPAGGQAELELSRPCRLAGRRVSVPLARRAPRRWSRSALGGAAAASPGAGAVRAGGVAGRIARQSARAVSELDKPSGITTRDILTDKAIENAVARSTPAFGGSANLLPLFIPAIATRGGLHDPGR